MFHLVVIESDFLQPCCKLARFSAPAYDFAQSFDSKRLVGLWGLADVLSGVGAVTHFPNMCHGGSQGTVSLRHRVPGRHYHCLAQATLCGSLG